MGVRNTGFIYAYTEPEWADAEWQGARRGQTVIKVGQSNDVSRRMREHRGVVTPDGTVRQELLAEFPVPNTTFDGKPFTDSAVRAVLREKIGAHQRQGEWVEATIEEVRAAIEHLEHGTPLFRERTRSFGMRPEQQEAVALTSNYFTRMGEEHPDRTSRFLWNAKMRFGKTFCAYQLAKEMGFKKILVLTYKPAVLDSWREDLETHIAFEGWQFKDPSTEWNTLDAEAPIVAFASFQDALGRSPDGGRKRKNDWLHDTDWDLIITDEYHFGAWRDNAKNLTGDGELREESAVGESFAADEIESLPSLRSRHYLYLSGTPFRALAQGEFAEDQIFNWTYTDEQRAKSHWNSANGENPYAELPELNFYTYQLPESIRSIAEQGDFNEFDLNAFFKASKVPGESESEPDQYVFANEEYVQKFLEHIRGQYHEDIRDTLGGEAPLVPFGNGALLDVLKHTFWFLPDVASCYAMAQLLAKPRNSFFADYNVVVAAGAAAGIGEDALKPVREAIGNGQRTKSITLSCGKLTTGVSVPEWSGVLMLRNAKTPESYFQTVFRAQTPWTVKETQAGKGTQTRILKPQCFVFDYAPNRTLRQIADYATQLSSDSSRSKEQQVDEFIRFLPVLCYEGFSMNRVNAGDLLDIIATGTGATMLARRWSSDRLLRIGHWTLEDMNDNRDVLDVLEKIESFRKMNKNRSLSTVVASERALREATTREDRDLTSVEIAEKKANEKWRKDLKEILRKFVARIPIFMYLTDYREESLVDIITKLEPDLFHRVTGLTIEDFERLNEVGVFNEAAMNQAIFTFRMFEDASLGYLDTEDATKDRYIGGYNTVIHHDDLGEVAGGLVAGVLEHGTWLVASVSVLPENGEPWRVEQIVDEIARRGVKDASRKESLVETLGQDLGEAISNGDPRVARLRQAPDGRFYKATPKAMPPGLAPCNF